MWVAVATVAVEGRLQADAAGVGEEAVAVGKGKETVDVGKETIAVGNEAVAVGARKETVADDVGEETIAVGGVFELHLSCSLFRIKFCVFIQI